MFSYVGCRINNDVINLKDILHNNKNKYTKWNIIKGKGENILNAIQKSEIPKLLCYCSKNMYERPTKIWQEYVLILVGRYMPRV